MKRTALLLVVMLLMGSVVAFAGQSHVSVPFSDEENGSTADASVESNRKWFEITRSYIGDSYMYMDPYYSGILYLYQRSGNYATYAGWLYRVPGHQPWGLIEAR